MLSIQDDMGPVAMGTGPCVDPIAGAGVGAALEWNGTSVGLGASTSDMPTSKLEDRGL
jgi:hypothetical protein